MKAYVLAMDMEFNKTRIIQGKVKALKAFYALCRERCVKKKDIRKFSWEDGMKKGIYKSGLYAEYSSASFIVLCENVEIEK